MNKEMVNIKKCEQIKQYLEGLSGFQDIGLVSRKRILTDLKKTYCFLCHKYTEAPLRIIAKVLRPGYNHATVLYNVKEFKKLNQIKQLECQYIFDKAEEEISKLHKEYSEINESISLMKPRLLSDQKHFEIFTSLVSKSHSIILRQSTQIFNLKERIKELEEIVLNNLEDILLDN